MTVTLFLLIILGGLLGLSDPGPSDGWDSIRRKKPPTP
jgi:hypothetical protein